MSLSWAPPKARICEPHLPTGFLLSLFSLTFQSSTASLSTKKGIRKSQNLTSNQGNRIKHEKPFFQKQ